MGLDMYLYRKTYVKNWSYMTPSERHEVTVKQHGKPVPGIKPERVAFIVEEVAYWRKANAIHRWFVDNVQDGRDDQREYYVSREQLTKLRDLCVDVLKAMELVPGKVSSGDSSRAEELLPTAAGFFFGSTDYDEGYSQDVRETAEVLTKLLAEPEDGGFYYRADW
jgi:hypothetical protein